MTDASSTEHLAPVKRGRGRPRKDSAFAALNKEVIASKALEIAGAEGYSALTMHRLAAEFGVTPRALYNYVADRQEVVNMAAELFIAHSPFIELDSSNWRESMREIYEVSREAFRAYPRASLVAMDEQIRVEPGPRRTQLIERLMQFFIDLGLSLQQTLMMVRSLERDVFGFVLQVDYYFDKNYPMGRQYVTRAVPEDWLDRHKDVDAPLARAALELPEQDNDELFAELVCMRIKVVEYMLSEAKAD